MAFKVEEKEFDWDLEVPIMVKEGEPKRTEIVKCVHQMNTRKYDDFLKHISKMIPTDEEVERMKKNTEVETSLISIIKQIDFLYQKGVEWWTNNVSPNVILSVQKYILSFSEIMGVKKTS